MLFRRRFLDGIRDGSITLAFRRRPAGRRPTVKSGGRLRTAVGVLAIESVDVVSLHDIDDEDARRAGFASRRELIEELEGREGTVYRIALRFAGEDPRASLRKRSALSPEELAEVLERLARLDRASRRGPWTRGVLELIAARPGTRAATLASKLGRETPRFKADVRKLKKLGLTESLEVGYRLSPRGERVLRALK